VTNQLQLVVVEIIMIINQLNQI